MTIQEQLAQLTQQITDQKTLIRTLSGEERHQATLALGELLLRKGELKEQQPLTIGLSYEAVADGYMSPRLTSRPALPPPVRRDTARYREDCIQ